MNNWKKSFIILWLGQGISLITSAILQMAIIWYITDKTNSALALSLATLFGFLPHAIFGPFIGVLVDRYSRKTVMICADLFIAAAGLALAFVALYMEVPLWVIFVILFLRSIGTAFHFPALNAATPLIVPENMLTKCAGYSQALQSISLIASPALAAILYASWALNSIVFLDVGGALIASLCTVFIKLKKQEQVPVARGNIINELKEGYFTLKENKGLFALLWVGAAYMVVFMPINALFPLLAMGYFGGNPVHSSIVEITFAVGMLLGGLLLGLWSDIKNRSVILGCSILLMGASLTIIGVLPPQGFVVFAICSGFMGLSAPLYGSVETALFQEKISEEYLGRAFSLLNSITSLAMPIGLALSGLFADKIGVNIWFLISGILIVLVGVACLLISSVRSLDTA